MSKKQRDQLYMEVVKYQQMAEVNHNDTQYQMPQIPYQMNPHLPQVIQ